MLVTMNEMLLDAKKNHYAIPAFDISNYEMMKAVLETCEEEKSPALLMGLGVDLQGRDMNLLLSIVKSASDFFNVPVCFHLDHATNFNIIKKAIDSGFSSVMYDGSVLPFDENALKKVMDTIRSFEGKEEIPDAILANYVYEHTYSNTQRVVHYRKKLPINRLFNFEESKRFGVGQFLAQCNL